MAVLGLPSFKELQAVGDLVDQIALAKKTGRRPEAGNWTAQYRSVHHESSAGWVYCSLSLEMPPGAKP